MPSHVVRRFTELTVWLAAHNESAQAFGLRAKVDKSKLSRLVNGNIRQFDLDLIGKVTTATRGEVGHEQFAAFGKRLLDHPVRQRRRRAA